MQRLSLFIKSIQFKFNYITYKEYYDFIKEMDSVKCKQCGYRTVTYGGISICHDILGPEISILGGHWLDTHPKDYKLTPTEASDLIFLICNKIKSN